MHRTASYVVKRPWLSAVLLVAFLCRALVPVGFMPGQGGLMLCPAYAPVAAPATPVAHHMSDADMSGMDMSTMDMSAAAMPAGMHHADQHDGNSFCPFASASAPAVCSHVIVDAVPAEVVATTLSYPPQQALPRGTIVPTRLPRGPPALA